MPKTPDEIKKGLECCATVRVGGNCPADCPLQILCYSGCGETERAILGCIQQLEKDKDDLLEERELNDYLRDKVKQLEAERDAAVADIRLAFTSYVGTCQTCKHGENQVDCIEPLRCGNCENEKCKCQSCDSYDSNWEWRGVQKEE